MEPEDIPGVLVAMLPVTDLARSAAFYRDLLGLTYRREFSRDGLVTGCALGAAGDAFAVSLRRRDTTPGRADLRAEHPLIFRVPDRAALDRVEANARRHALAPTRGGHADAEFVEVVDPDGICIRLAVALRPWDAFVGVEFAPDGAVREYAEPLLTI